MDKKKILLLVGGVAVIVIVAVATQYLAMKSNSQQVFLQMPPLTATEEPPAFIADSYSGTIQSVDSEKVVIAKVDGGTEEYVTKDIMNLYDNRILDTMKPIKVEDLQQGMQVQVSLTTNQADNTVTTSLVLY